MTGVASLEDVRRIRVEKRRGCRTWSPSLVPVNRHERGGPCVRMSDPLQCHENGNKPTRELVVILELTDVLGSFSARSYNLD